MDNEDGSAQTKVAGEQSFFTDESQVWHVKRVIYSVRITLAGGSLTHHN